MAEKKVSVNVKKKGNEEEVDREEFNQFETTDGTRQTRETNDKAVSEAGISKMFNGFNTDAAALQFHADQEETQRQSNINFKIISTQHEELFNQLMSERQALFPIIIDKLKA